MSEQLYIIEQTSLHLFLFPSFKDCTQSARDKMAPKKMIHLNFFEMACTGSHMGIGMWKYANPVLNELKFVD